MPTPPDKLDSFVFELTPACNHACLHCYNAWKNPGVAAPALLDAPRTLAMLDRMLDQTGARHVTLTGGEPILRDDVYDIARHLAAERACAVNIISNGRLLTAASLERLRPHVALFELPLLSCDAAIHDRMSGSAGAFNASTLAIAEIKAMGGRVVTVFVATRLNLPTLRETIELAFALGADAIMFNRFNPGGEGGHNVELLQASPADLRAALDTLQALHTQYGIQISCSIAMPPCLFDHARWPGLSFGFCAAGTSRAYYTLDPVGNVRPCNHSPRVLGNILRQNFADMVRSAAMADFMAARPAFCAGCRLEATCQGGCKAAAEACYGDVAAEDPFLRAFKHEAVRPT